MRCTSFAWCAVFLVSSGCATLSEERSSIPLAPSASALVVQPARERATLVVEQIEGAASARVRAALAPAQQAVAACRAGMGGVIRLRITSAPGGARFSVEPTLAIDPRAQRCVLEALSTINLEGVSGDPSPSARPSGFTALVRVEW